MRERMAHYQVPGVSVAVVDGGRLVWARGFGDGVDEHTIFQAASISKVVAATATLRLVDEGKLDLDADVNGVLRSWKVPSSEKITLRQILSHTAGLNVHGFTGYAPDAPMPTLLQVLDGTPPAANEPIRVVAKPGSATSYSGGGIVIEQLVLTDVTGRPFPELMQELVLAPLAMRDTTFAQPLPPAFRARAARGHEEDGSPTPGGWHIGPEMAAGWMWTTAADLMRWAMAIDASRDGRPHAILSQKTAAEMLTSQKDLYGLGPVLEGSGRAFAFGHGGNNPGYTTQVIYFPETNQGAAILVNKVGADQLLDEITRAIAATYHWPAMQPERVKPFPFDASTLAGNYEVRFPGAEPSPATIVVEKGRLYLTAAPILEHDELVAVSATELISPAWGYRMQLDASGGFIIHYNQNDIPGTRVK